MLDHLTGFPDQLAEAQRIGEDVPLSVSPDGVTSIVALGMGGSAIGGSIIGAYLAAELPVPFRVSRDYSVPGFVGPRTLAIAVSYSGNTEETLSAYRAARVRGARMIAVTTGGELARLAEEAGDAVVRIPAGLPPRAAIGYSLVPVLIVLTRLGYASDQSAGLEEAIALARTLGKDYGPATPACRNAAKELAQWMHGQIPVIYGSAALTAPVAERWCGQLSENAKTIGHWNELPEMNHNEIVGWAGARGVAGGARVVFLRDADDHLRVSKRAELTREAVARAGAGTRVVESVGERLLARLFSLVILGDFASFYLASLSGVDPTPVEPIDRLKKALAEE
jgi:glucose/mannose-6-phosphate isomerase